MKILFYAKTLKKKLSTMKDGDSDLTRIFLQKKMAAYEVWILLLQLISEFSRWADYHIAQNYKGFKAH